MMAVRKVMALKTERLLVSGRPILLDVSMEAMFVILSNPTIKLK